MAHPLQLKAGRETELESVLKGLVDLGLGGIECYYRNHSKEDTRALLGLAKKYNLAATGGLDFHGANRPEIRLGIGEGDLKVPVECWEKLQDSCRSALQSAKQGSPAP